jgi:hypothetical protein
LEGLVVFGGFKESKKKEIMLQAPHDCDIVLRHAAALKKLCERRKQKFMTQ